MSDHHYTPTGILGTIFTMGFWILSHYALTDIAAVIAIITGLTTIAVNIKRFIKNNNNGH